MTNPSQAHDDLVAKLEPAGAVDADNGPVRIDSVRVPFYDEVQERCVIFARDLLTLIPELESVAVVPSYEKVTEDAPAAILVGREGPPKTAIEVMHLSAQMLRAWLHLQKHAGGFLKYMSQELAEHSRQIHEKRNELERLDAELAKRADAATAERPTASGATPSGPGQSENPGMGPITDR